ncbi:hypothetical protein [Sphingomonas sp. Mn802worker]|uniref:hypothetical protein n=1 Tax=Sphingomonas sp. Mn802worker TaxID=629773 RepID=UPI000375357F|nr:hypothetical protein [Sphingomonas sp. Mn802worker]
MSDSRFIATGTASGRASTNHHGETFGAWLRVQVDRERLVGQLVAGAKLGRRFPRDGSPEDVRRHLAAMQAEDDLFEAVDEADIDWRAY